MKSTMRLLVMIFAVAIVSISCSETELQSSVSSPDGNLVVNTGLNATGTPVYAVTFKGKTIVDTSTVGFEFKDMEYLGKNMTLTGASSSTMDETWEMPWANSAWYKTPIMSLNWITVNKEMLPESFL